MKQEEKKLSISGMSCTNCAKGIEKKLQEKGYKNVNDIDGGIMALKSFGIKTFSSKILVN